MIIPIRLESEPEAVTGSAKLPQETSLVPIVTFPSSERTEINDMFGLIRPIEKTFGDILLPALSKYLQLRDSKRKDFRDLLLKDHPLQIENFKSNGEKYELQLNVQKFKPEELHVKITDDFISILGEHEEGADRNNYTRQQFLRRYSLPAKVNPDDIKCELSSDGYLMISAPKIAEKVRITEIPSLPIDRHSRNDEKATMKTI